MKIAIIYSTSSRTTKKAAKILQNKINCKTQLIPIEKAKSACLLKYNFIILAGSINNGKVQGELKRYISRNMKTLREKPTALFINCSETGENSKNFDKTFSQELVDSSFISSNFGDEINPDEGNFFEKRSKINLLSKYKKEGKEIPMLNLEEIDHFANYINDMIKQTIWGGIIFKLDNIISIKDFDREDIEYILDEAVKLEDIAKSKEISEELKGKILGCMFFEPSTRTRLSFETSMKRLGGECIGFSSSGSSSVSKGETIADTAKMFEAYSDVLVIRHELEGVSKFISDIVDVPVINAGDGAGQHPTQTLLDLYTIRKEYGHIDNLKIALIGDLKYGRTVHSLANALTLFDNIELYFVSPEDLKMPDEILHDLDKTNITYKELDNVKDVIDIVDVLYVTRIQKERFADIEEYLKIKGAYVINKNLIDGKDLIVMHPLPRVDEISEDVDNTKYNKYFLQAFNAVPVRMAILKTLLRK